MIIVTTTPQALPGSVLTDLISTHLEIGRAELGNYKGVVVVARY